MSYAEELLTLGDETLYVRLLKVHERYPRDYDARDYDQRRDAWEAEIAAVNAEIDRRGVAPPAWWNAAMGVPVKPNRSGRALRFAAWITAYLAACAAAIALFGGPALAVTFWFTVLAGGAWILVQNAVSDRQRRRSRR